MLQDKLAEQQYGERCSHYRKARLTHFLNKHHNDEHEDSHCAVLYAVCEALHYNIRNRT